mgnify:CR=1 FL=1|jgi:hypothetical protein
MVRALIMDTVAMDVLCRVQLMAGAMEGRAIEVVGAGVVGADVTAKAGVGDGEDLDL